MSETAAEVIAAQNEEPYWIVNQTCDNLLADHVLEDVFAQLGLPYGNVPHAFADGPFPLTADEERFIGEDTVRAPYGGAMTGPAWLYQGKKYIGVDVEVCYDGGDRPFSVESYGGTLYADSETALSEARRLAEFLTPKLAPIGGLAVAIPGGPDRHFVAVMLPPQYLNETFGTIPGCKPFSLFKHYVKSLFKGYKPAATPIAA